MLDASVFQPRKRFDLTLEHILTDPEWFEKIRDGRENEILTAVPATGGDESLTLPVPMYQRLLAVRGWVLSRSV